MAQSVFSILIMACLLASNAKRNTVFSAGGGAMHLEEQRNNQSTSGCTPACKNKYIVNPIDCEGRGVCAGCGPTCKRIRTLEGKKTFECPDDCHRAGVLSCAGKGAKCSQCQFEDCTFGKIGKKLHKLTGGNGECKKTFVCRVEEWETVIRQESASDDNRGGFDGWSGHGSNNIQ